MAVLAALRDMDRSEANLDVKPSFSPPAEIRWLKADLFRLILVILDRKVSKPDTNLVVDATRERSGAESSAGSSSLNSEPRASIPAVEEPKSDKLSSKTPLTAPNELHLGHSLAPPSLVLPTEAVPNVVPDVTQGIVEENKVSISRVKSIIRDSRPPISNLPAELLGIVFEHYLAREKGCILYLLLICRRWHETIMGMSKLWSCINLQSTSPSDLYTETERHIQQIQVCSSNSGSLPLDLNIQYGFEVLEEDIGKLRISINSIFMALRGAESTLALRWRSLRFILPTYHGRSFVHANDCGLTGLSVPNLEHLSIEMLVNSPMDGHLLPSPYFSNLSRVENLVLDDERKLECFPGVLEHLQALDIRVNQQPFSSSGLIRFPGLNSLILRHEERDDHLKSAFTSSLEHLWDQIVPGFVPDSTVSIQPQEGRPYPIPTLCVQAAWISEFELPNLAPTRLAWDTLQSSLLGQFKHTTLAKGSITTLLEKYPMVDYLVFPGSSIRYGIWNTENI
ncbi:hypothetical protein M408DRAFT_317555 [Serendipita vermifera MAFF 305830]|uniref:F-box domain-containing protein n=1 Tax=Serendipita vermifera MAFF 305830 TaxID=933852 RepID=A0A0C2WDJ6_SERVB|nr:hypothetical protein M408DRAFT_317555 [Serendipita vermifera MAFF 305830]